MGLLIKRPLATAGLLTILSAALAASLALTASTVVTVVIAALCLASAVFYFRHRSSYRRFLPFLLLLGVLLAFGRVVGGRWYEHNMLEGCQYTEIDGELEIEEIVYRSSYGSGYYVTLERLNGEDCDLTVALTTDALSPFFLEDRIAGVFFCTPIEDAAVDSEARAAYRAAGVCAILTPVGNDRLSLIESGTGSFSAALYDLRYCLHGGISEIVGGEEGELVGALLLGTRDGLDARTVRDFRRTGLSHLLALSGLHLMILTSLIGRFLRLLRVGKHPQICVLLLFCAFYLFLTGFSFSMMRAVSMLLLSQVAFFLGGEYDGLTALGFGGAVIVMLTPGAVFDLSFQMTMLATFGILGFGTLQTKLAALIPGKKGIRRLLAAPLRFLIGTIFVTLAATLAVLPIQWLIFGEMSLISPVSNLPTVLLATPLLAIGLVLLLGMLCGITVSFLGLPLRLLAGAILEITGRLSLTDCVISLKRSFVPYILIPLFVLTGLLLLIRLSKRKQWLLLLPSAVAVIAFALCFNIGNAIGVHGMEVVYRTTGQNEGIVLLQNDRAVICDISGGSVKQLSSDLAVLDVSEVEVLMLTHYHSAHSATVAKFCRSNLVRALWLPEPENEQDQARLIDILAVAQELELPVTVYGRDRPLTVFESGTLTLSPSLTDARAVEPAFYMDISFGESRLRYQSAAYDEYARQQGVDIKEGSHTHLILGGHGPRPRADMTVTGSEALREVWIANDQIAMRCREMPDIHYIVCPEVRSLVME